MPKEGDERLLHQSQVVLKKENLENVVGLASMTQDSRLRTKRVRFAEPLIRLNPITRARAAAKTNSPGQELPAATDLPATTDLPALPARTILPPERTTPLLPPTIKDLFTEHYQTDPELASILQALKTNQSRHKRITLAECVERDGYLYYRDRLYVPNCPELHAELLRMYHESPVAGHMGRARTYEALSREYYWPNMLDYVEQWVRNCHTCVTALSR